MQQQEKTKTFRFSGIILHLHPRYINEEAIAFKRTFGLGGMGAFLILLLFITGISLRFYYDPYPSKAYDSVVFIKNNILFGQLIRNIHHWSGVFLVVISFLHLLRTFLTGAFRSPRKINWLIGLLLFALVVASNFTGYLLPWDQLAYWAITVGTSLLNYLPIIGSPLRSVIIGGEEVNSGTLLIFFNFHTSVLPLLILLLTVYHFWRVRKAGGIILPYNTEEKKILPVYPHLVYREFVTALALFAVIMFFSVFFNAPLQAKANPDISINPTKAPWYFAGIQELLMHFHPFAAAFLIPGVLVLSLIVLPFVKLKEEPTGDWFHSGKSKQAAGFSAMTGSILTIVLIIISELLPDPETLLPFLNSFISNGIIPILILTGILWYYFKYIKKKYELNFTEFIQIIFVFIVVVFIILTIIGIFFRGVDMALTLPWNI